MGGEVVTRKPPLRAPLCVVVSVLDELMKIKYQVTKLLLLQYFIVNIMVFFLERTLYKKWRTYWKKKIFYTQN